MNNVLQNNNIKFITFLKEYYEINTQYWLRCPQKRGHMLKTGSIHIQVNEDKML